MEVPSYADMVRALTRILKPHGLLVLVEAELSFVSVCRVLLTPGLRERHAGTGRREVVCGRAPRHRRDGHLDLVDVVDVVAITAAARRRAARRSRSCNGTVVSLPSPSSYLITLPY